jgi:hypothetical protein
MRHGSNFGEKAKTILRSWLIIHAMRIDLASLSKQEIKDYLNLGITLKIEPLAKACAAYL